MNRILRKLKGVIYIYLFILYFGCSALKHSYNVESSYSDCNIVLKKINDNNLNGNLYIIENINTIIKFENLKRKFNANIKIIRDSAIIISVIPILGIELYRILITKDSIFIIDRLKRNLLYGEYLNFMKNYDIEFPLGFIQNILLGNSNEVKDSNSYFIKSNNESFIKLENNYRTKDRNANKLCYHSFVVEKSKGKIIESLYKCERNLFKIQYKGLKMNSEFTFPSEENIIISGKKGKILIIMEISNISSVKNLKWKFIYPESYEVKKL